MSQAEQQAEQHRKNLEFASQYRAAFPLELLRHLYATIVERTLPPTATHAELAANNAQRALVIGFIRQVDLSNTQGTSKCSHDVIFTPQPQTEAPVAKASRPRRRKQPLRE